MDALELSLIIPCLNEAKRLGSFLLSVESELESRGIGFEILVIDDGSTDETAAVAQTGRFTKLIRHSQNRGKGAAVRTGLLAAEGRYVLFADADGSTPISELPVLLNGMGQQWDLAIGSRAIKQGKVFHYDRGQGQWTGKSIRVPRVNWQTHPGRVLMGRVYAWLVKLILGLPFEDTQCGFKLLSNSFAQRLGSLLVTERFSFDAEILLWAREAGLRVAEIPVNWTHQPSSRVSFLRDIPKMVKDLWRLRRKFSPSHSLWITAGHENA